MRAANPRRRRLLAGATAALALACAKPRAARAAAGHAARVPQRIVVLNWALTETLLALGGTPVGIPLPDWYTSTIVTPPLPRGVVDVGLLYQPNFDVLLALAPDLLIVTPAHAGLLGPLQRIEPTLTLGEYMTDARPFERLCGETQTLARALDAPARGGPDRADAAGRGRRCRAPAGCACPGDASGHRCGRNRRAASVCLCGRQSVRRSASAHRCRRCRQS